VVCLGVFQSIVTIFRPRQFNINLVTASKIHMISSSTSAKKDSPVAGMGGSVSDICTYIDPDQLLSEYGGSMQWEWNFEEYWKEIEQIWQ
jgi:hypothetical protein